MSKTKILSIAVVGVIALGFLLTLQQGTAPIDLVITVTADYEGNSVGSITMDYHWQSKEMNIDTEYQEIDWQAESVSASSSPTNEMERKIVQYLADSTVQTGMPCWMHLYDDGSWEMGVYMSIGGLPLTLSFAGVGVLVNDVTVSGDVNLIPQGLKTELQNMGISGLDVTLGWKLNVSRNFLEDWAANVFEIFSWIWEGIVHIGSQFLGHIDF